MLVAMDQYASLSEAFETASPDEIWAWVVDSCFWVAVSAWSDDIAAVFVKRLVNARGLPFIPRIPPTLKRVS
jgi:hypothetical protein